MFEFNKHTEQFWLEYAWLVAFLVKLLLKMQPKMCTEWHFSCESFKLCQQLTTVFDNFQWFAVQLFDIFHARVGRKSTQTLKRTHTHTQIHRCEQASQNPLRKQSLIAVNQTAQSPFHKFTFFFSCAIFLRCYLWAPISVTPKKFLHLHGFFFSPTIQCRK